MAAAGWILSSVLLVSGTAYGLFFYYRDVQRYKRVDSNYHIVAIVQKSRGKELLQAEYLAEQLGLSIDRPTNLYAFDKKRGEEHLLRNPLIRSASIHKVSPGTLFIDYSIRRPAAYLGNFSNTALDEEGILIPFKPFFTPKTLPTILLGNRFFETWKPGEYWGHSIQGEEYTLAKSIIQFFEKEKCGTLHVIDLKGVKSESLGKREIVVTLYNPEKIFLRLSVDQLMRGLKDYKDTITAFSQLHPAKQQPYLFDLRLESQLLIDYKR